MDVSIILVNYNTKDLTINCIRSVYASETRYSFEIIVVDNTSSDGSVDLIRDLFPEVNVIENKQNVGFANANNQGAAVAAGRYLYILNSDTEIEKDVIEKVVSYGDINKNAGVIGTKVVFPNGELQENFYRFPTLLSELIFFTISIIKSNDWFLFKLNKYKSCPLKKPFEVDVISGCSMFVKREVYKQTGLFSEEFFMYYEDAEFCYRVKKSGFDNIYYQNVLVTHHHMGSSKGSKKNYKLLASCFNGACIYFRSVKNILTVFFFRIICFAFWLIELTILKFLSKITRDERILRKLKMITVLLSEFKLYL